MPHPNTRLYKTEVATVNSVPLGGPTTISCELGHDVQLPSYEDQTPGLTGMELLVPTAKGKIVTEDVKKFLPLLTSTPGDMTWYSRESMQQTYAKHTAARAVILGGILQFPVNRQAAYASMALDYQLFGDPPLQDFADLVQFEDGQDKPEHEEPEDRLSERLMFPVEAYHGDQRIWHPGSVTVSLQPQVVSRAHGDGDIGYSMIDVFHDNVRFTLSFEDTTKQDAAEPYHQVATALMQAGPAPLALKVKAGTGSGEDQAVVLRNAKFTRDAAGYEAAPKDYVEHQLTGVLEWRGGLDEQGDPADEVHSLFSEPLIMAIMDASEYEFPDPE